MEKEKKTIVIFGVSSFVGSNLAEYLKNDYKIIGTYYSNNISINGALTIPCDVLNKDDVRLVLLAFKPDIAIYSVGMSSVVECDNQEELGDALNTGGLVNVVEFCQRHKTQVIYLSTGMVFGGENKKYSEMDIPDASTNYGKMATSSEFFIQKNCLNYLIVRSSKLYGRSAQITNQNWFEQLQQKFQMGEEIKLDHKIKFGFLDIYFLAFILKLLFKKETTNRIFQLCSTESSTLYEFASLYADIFGEEKSLISKVKSAFPLIKDIDSVFEGQIEQRYEMTCSNIESFLEIKMPTIKESLEVTFQRLNGSQGSDKTTDFVKFI